jgi:hypothetical protein
MRMTTTELIVYSPPTLAAGNEFDQPPMIVFGIEPNP